MEQLINHYGIWTVAGIYIAKTVYDVLVGSTARYIKAIDSNTDALKKVSKDLRVAFHNLKEIREKAGLGPVSTPPEFDQ